MIYNSQIKIFNPKTFNGYFVVHYKESKGFRFYYPFYTTRIINVNRVVYFEDVFAFVSKGPRGA